MTPEAVAQAIVDGIEREDADALAAIAARGGSAAFTDERIARVWAAFPEAGRRARAAALAALAAVGYRLATPSPREVLDAFVQYVEWNELAILETMLALGVRVAPDDPQHEAIADYFEGMGSADVIRLLPVVARAGFTVAVYPALLARHCDDPEAIGLLLRHGADPDAPMHDGTVFDRALDGPREDPAGHLAALALMAARVSTPLDPAIVAQLARLGGTVPDPSGWSPGTMPCSLWMFSETRWPPGTVLRSQDPDGRFADIHPARLSAWTEGCGWDVRPPAGFLWLWTTTEVQTMLALRPDRHGHPYVHVLEHDQPNTIELGRRLGPFLADLARA